MSYQYDAFFSYKRNEHTDDWNETVKEKLAFWLSQELGGTRVSIFFDRENIRSGNRWRQKLGDALRQSKCLVCMWSPNYFQSKWCVSEWQTFVEREQRFAGGRSLIVPARFHDGSTYPPAAQEYQSADFRSFASTMPAFWQTARAVDFEQPHLQDFARDLAASIRNSPAYDAAFPLVEALDSQVMADPTVGRPGDSVA